MQERLHKILSQWGIASRRRAEVLIRAGRVRVNGELAQIGQLADPQTDVIELDGQVIQMHDRPRLYYFLLHKPLRVVSSCDDPQGRKTVLAFLPPALQQGTGIHPVGRLDYFSTGALLLTNDGDLTYRLTHPRHHIPKTYRVIVAGTPTEPTLRQWRAGFLLEGRKTAPAQVRLLSAAAHQAELEVILWEGRNRQIRRVAEALGHPVKALHRLAIGPIRLGSLAPGQLRELTPTEHRQLSTDLDNPAVPNS